LGEFSVNKYTDHDTDPLVLARSLLKIDLQSVHPHRNIRRIGKGAGRRTLVMDIQLGLRYDTNPLVYAAGELGDLDLMKTLLSRKSEAEEADFQVWVQRAIVAATNFDRGDIVAHLYEISSYDKSSMAEAIADYATAHGCFRIAQKLPTSSLKDSWYVREKRYIQHVYGLLESEMVYTIFSNMGRQGDREEALFFSVMNVRPRLTKWLMQNFFPELRSKTLDALKLAVAGGNKKVAKILQTSVLANKLKIPSKLEVMIDTWGSQVI
jgi:hypothetical protein